MKNTYKIILILITYLVLFIGLDYAVFAFVNLQPNPALWSEIHRAAFCFVGFYGMSIIPILIAFIDDDFDN